MPLRAIPVSELTKVGIGVQRPEDVVVSQDGRVWLSDQASACAEARPDGSLRRVGEAGGAPNGINMDAEGRIIIANVGGLDRHGSQKAAVGGGGPLQRLDTETGALEVLCTAVGGTPLVSSNYPIIDRAGNIYCSHSTSATVTDAFDGRADGFLFRSNVDGTVDLLAEGLQFANGLALDAAESHLYVCQTTGCNVICYAIRADGSLGDPEQYGPRLGLTIADVRDQRPFSPETRGTLGLPDGCGFDQDGNLWVTLPMSNKVVAITPAGGVETMIEDLEGDVMRSPTNVSWGGEGLEDLYIGSIVTDYVVKARSPVPGLPLIHQS